MVNQWNNLILKFTENVQNLKEFEDKKNIKFKITIITFDHGIEVIGNQRMQLTDIQNYNIRYRGGGTNFENVFKEVNSILNLKEEKTIFVFMTDGCAPYPK